MGLTSSVTVTSGKLDGPAAEPCPSLSCFLLREVALDIYPALRKADITSCLTLFSLTPAAVSFNSVSSRSWAGVLYCL